MNQKSSREHPTIACCGIDCGLCPQHYSAGQSRCPGCGGEDFSLHHPSCSILTCCAKKNKFQTCADCGQFPCAKMAEWDAADSFVSHKNSLANLRAIRKEGITCYVEAQKQRVAWLEKVLTDYDDGRSKSFFCLAATFLSMPELTASRREADDRSTSQGLDSSDKKGKAKILKELLQKRAGEEHVELKMRKLPA
nr:DUF3795 domain-containing protein [Candidatus Sigynarchaeota archaeon]